MAKTQKENKPEKITYSKALGNFICDKIEEGMTLAAVIREYPGYVPSDKKTIHRWKKKYPDFKLAMEQAYQAFLYDKLDEIVDLANEPTPNTGAKAEDFAIIQTRRLKIETLKFLLAKVAPKIIPELQDKNTNTVASMPNITLMMYGQRPTESQEAKEISYDNKKSS